MKFVPDAIARTVARNALHAQKASPEVLLVGVAGMVEVLFSPVVPR